MIDANKPQPAPEPNQSPAVWDVVIADMKERDNTGFRKYGTRLQAGNGRDQLVDAYQEVLDLAVYLRAALIEREAARVRLQRNFEAMRKDGIGLTLGQEQAVAAGL